MSRRSLFFFSCLSTIWYYVDFPPLPWSHRFMHVNNPLASFGLLERWSIGGFACYDMHGRLHTRYFSLQVILFSLSIIFCCKTIWAEWASSQQYRLHPLFSDHPFYLVIINYIYLPLNKTKFVSILISPINFFNLGNKKAGGAMNA